MNVYRPVNLPTSQSALRNPPDQELKTPHHLVNYTVVSIKRNQKKQKPKTFSMEIPSCVTGTQPVERLRQVLTCKRVVESQTVTGTSVITTLASSFFLILPLSLSPSWCTRSARGSHLVLIRDPRRQVSLQVTAHRPPTALQVKRRTRLTCFSGYSYWVTCS